MSGKKGTLTRNYVITEKGIAYLREHGLLQVSIRDLPPPLVSGEKVRGYAGCVWAHGKEYAIASALASKEK